MTLDVNKAVADLDASVLKDQFSGTTRAVRRNLLIAASLAILISLEGIKLGNVFGMELSNSVSLALAKGAISVVVLYELFSFVVYGWIDYAAWRIKTTSLLISYGQQVLVDTLKNTGQVVDQLGYIRSKIKSDDDSAVDAIKSQSGVMDQIVNSAESLVKKYNEDFNALSKRAKLFSCVQWGRIYLLDWGIPLAIGGVALYRNGTQLVNFFAALAV